MVSGAKAYPKFYLGRHNYDELAVEYTGNKTLIRNNVHDFT